MSLFIYIYIYRKAWVTKLAFEAEKEGLRKRIEEEKGEVDVGELVVIYICAFYSFTVIPRRSHSLIERVTVLVNEFYHSL